MARTARIPGRVRFHAMQGSDDIRPGVPASPTRDAHEDLLDLDIAWANGGASRGVTAVTTANGGSHSTDLTSGFPGLADDPVSGPRAPAVPERRTGPPPVRGGFRDEWPARLWRTLSFKPTVAFVVAAVLAVLVGLVSEYATLRGATVWTSRTVMIIDQPGGIAAAGDEGLLLKLTAVRYKYQGLAATSVIAGPVANKLGLPVGVVEGSTSVVAPADSLLLDVYGVWSGPAGAQRLSAAEAQQISTFVQNETATYKIPANQQFTMSVVDPASPASPSGPSHSKAAAVAIALAIAAFLVGFALTQLVRNRGLAP